MIKSINERVIEYVESYFEKRDVLRESRFKDFLRLAQSDYNKEVLKGR